MTILLKVPEVPHLSLLLIFVFSCFLFTSRLFLAPECNNPSLLSEADRVKTFNNKNVVKCDSHFRGATWYRFSGGAGAQIPESVVPTWHCGTHAPGWMDGKHPSVGEGVVSRKVCFHWTSGNCQWSNTIQVRNCGNFYVYKLVKPPGCSMRYCGEQTGE